MKEQFFSGTNENGLRCILRYANGTVSEVYAIKVFGRNNYSKHAAQFGVEFTKRPSVSQLKERWNKHVRSGGFLNELITELNLLDVPPGRKFRRIARSTYANPKAPPSAFKLSPREATELQQGKSELASLLSRLRQVCRILQPEGTNLAAYGIEISEIHILTCIGIEGQFRSILTANNYTKSRLLTRDFIKVLKPTKLNEYGIGYVGIVRLKSFVIVSVRISGGFNN